MNKERAQQRNDYKTGTRVTLPIASDQMLKLSISTKTLVLSPLPCGIPFNNAKALAKSIRQVNAALSLGVLRVPIFGAIFFRASSSRLMTIAGGRGTVISNLSGIEFSNHASSKKYLSTIVIAMTGSCNVPLP
jgi:hypothetical protein